MPSDEPRLEVYHCSLHVQHSSGIAALHVVQGPSSIGGEIVKTIPTSLTKLTLSFCSPLVHCSCRLPGLPYTLTLGLILSRLYAPA